MPANKERFRLKFPSLFQLYTFAKKMYNKPSWMIAQKVSDHRSKSKNIKYNNGIPFDGYPKYNESIDKEKFSNIIINNINGLPATTNDKAADKNSDFILLACLPKSGSTFLTKCLQNTLDIPHIPLSYEFKRNEQDLYFPSLVYYSDKALISQHHLRATEANINLINGFNIKTVVLVRNIFDVLISLRDHLINEGLENPSCYIDKDFISMKEEEQLDMLVDLAAPWYINFYVSWYVASKKKKIKPLWLTYEDVTSDTKRCLERVADFLDRTPDKERIESAISELQNQNTRLNKGITGRGQRIMNDRQKNHIRRLCSYYPSVNFEKLGVK